MIYGNDFRLIIQYWDLGNEVSWCDFLLVLEVLKYPQNIPDAPFIALLTLYLAVLVELPQKKLYCNCCLVNVSQFCCMALRPVH